MIDNSKEYILCASIWYQDLSPIELHHCKPVNIDRGIVLCGWRHGDIIAQMIELKGLRTVTNGDGAAGEHEQGFLTSQNRFVDRKTAQVIAYRAKQGTNMTIGSELFSEDIY